MRNHAKSIVACDFFTVVTATFKVIYGFVVVDHSTRRILHWNVTEHPTSEWTLQQLREAIPNDHGFRYLIRECIMNMSSKLPRKYFLRSKTPIVQ